MAISPNGAYLYAALEGATVAEPGSTRRSVFEFSVRTEAFTGRVWNYRTEQPGFMVADMWATDRHHLVVIERDAGRGLNAMFRNVYVVDRTVVDTSGALVKSLVVDLAAIPDPDLISLPEIHTGDVGLGDPFHVTCESVEAIHPISRTKLLIGCDNNLPNTGRNPTIADDTELIVVRSRRSCGPELSFRRAHRLPGPSLSRQPGPRARGIHPGRCRAQSQRSCSCGWPVDASGACDQDTRRWPAVIVRGRPRRQCVRRGRRGRRPGSGSSARTRRPLLRDSRRVPARARRRRAAPRNTSPSLTAQPPAGRPRRGRRRAPGVRTAARPTRRRGGERRSLGLLTLPVTGSSAPMRDDIRTTLGLSTTACTTNR